MSTFITIKRDVRQHCVFSTDLFNIYSEMILRELEDLNGLTIGGVNITNLSYADDTVLVADSQDDL